MKHNKGKHQSSAKPDKDLKTSLIQGKRQREDSHYDHRELQRSMDKAKAMMTQGVKDKHQDLKVETPMEETVVRADPSESYELLEGPSMSMQVESRED